MGWIEEQFIGGVTLQNLSNAPAMIKIPVRNEASIQPASAKLRQVVVNNSPSSRRAIDQQRIISRGNNRRVALAHVKE